MTQTIEILNHLKSGKSLTPLDALQMFGCFRLGARVYDLKKAGHNIISKMISLPNGKKVAEYSLQL